MTSQVQKYHPRLYQIDELIFDVHNFVYGKNTDKYQVKVMDPTGLKMNRFKLDDYDLDAIFEKTKVKYVGSEPTGIDGLDQIVIKRQGETYMTNIRVVPYESPDIVSDIHNPVNVNQIIRTLLSELVVTEHTNNLLLPIINIDVTGEDLIEYDVFDPIKGSIDKNKIYSVELTEKFYTMTDLGSYLDENPPNMEVWKFILYQIVDLLYQINNVYPDFHHNRFIPSVIDCYLKNINGVIFPEIKLGNFFTSEIDDVIHNSYITAQSIPKSPTPYSDLYQFINYLITHKAEELKGYPEVTKFIDEIFPEKIRSDNEYLTEEKWNLLTVDEKDHLRLKNIRSHAFLNKSAEPTTASFVETKEEYGFNMNNVTSDKRSGSKTDMFDNADIELTDNEKEELDDDSIKVNKIVKQDNVFEEPTSDSISIDGGITSIAEDNESEFNANEQSDPTASVEVDDIEENMMPVDPIPDQLFDTELKEKITDKKDDNFDFGSESESSDSESDSNKKSSDYDIDTMSNKGNKKSSKKNTSEQTEDIISDKPSRIINVDDSDAFVLRRKPTVSKSSSTKTYHGKRQIMLPDYAGSMGSNSNGMDSMGSMGSMDSFDRSAPRYNADQMNNGNNNREQARINSIGSFLGASHNDLIRPQTDYNMLARDSAGSSNYPMDMLRNTQMPVMPGQMPGQMPQNQMQQGADPQLARYLMASQGQTPQPSQDQMTPEMYAMLAGQQGQQMQMPMQGMPMQGQQMQMPMQGMPMQGMPMQGQVPSMLGGAQRNPFFFR